MFVPCVGVCVFGCMLGCGCVHGLAWWVVGFLVWCVGVLDCWRGGLFVWLRLMVCVLVQLVLQFGVVGGVAIVVGVCWCCVSLVVGRSWRRLVALVLAMWCG